MGAVELLLEEVEVELEEERFEHFLDVLEVNSLAAVSGELRLHDGRFVGEKAAFDGLFLVLVQQICVKEDGVPELHHGLEPQVELHVDGNDIEDLLEYIQELTQL